MISFPAGTEMFQFPAFPPRLAAGIPTYIGMGYPIQKPKIDNAYWRAHLCYRAHARVFHRLKLPRHPPLALVFPISFVCHFL